MEKKLKAAGMDLSATEAWQVLRTVRVVDLDLSESNTKRCVTRGSKRAARILSALGISKSELPTPLEGAETVV